jgi:hypothetical protein
MIGTGVFMTEEQKVAAIKCHRNLIRSSGDLWRLIKFEKNYGDTLTVVGRGGVLTHDEAIEKALDELEVCLQESGASMYVPPASIIRQDSCR